MKAKEYNEIKNGFLKRRIFMNSEIIHRLAKHDEKEIKVFSVSISDKDGDELYITTIGYEGNEMARRIEMLFHCSIKEINEMWSFKIDEPTENEKELLEIGYFASDEIVKNESELKFDL